LSAAAKAHVAGSRVSSATIERGTIPNEILGVELQWPSNRLALQPRSKGLLPAHAGLTLKAVSLAAKGQFTGALPLATSTIRRTSR
jgi:hypothetical protein